jgi:hypothetical protein
MKWVTRQNASVDRIACPWLVKRFIDPEAVFLYVPAGEVAGVAKRFAPGPIDGQHAVIGADKNAGLGQGIGQGQEFGKWVDSPLAHRPIVPRLALCGCLQWHS